MSAAVTHPPFTARRGARARTWWAKAWVRALEEAAYTETDLRAGRALARAGAVGGVTAGHGELLASVNEPHGLFTVVVRLPALAPEAVDALIEVVAAQTGRIGALLAGHLPHELVEHADEQGAELLPSGHDLEASCTCDAWLDPCPHALAVLVQAGWLVEADPLVLFGLRGLPRDELVARLHRYRPVGGRALPDDDDEGDGAAAALDVAADAALRAARVLELLDGHGETNARVDHLF